LTAGKVLHAGASIRTGSGASVVLAMEEQGSLLRMGAMRRLDLAAAAPAKEGAVTIVPLQAKILTVKETATEFAAQ
jgi:energy-converting hydrogenase Eha subunit C